MPRPPSSTAWPALPYAEWADTCETLRLWCQIVGKVRLARTPWLNHSWQTPLYLTARGLTTGLIPHGERALDLEFDFVDQALRARTDVAEASLALRPMAVSAFHAEVMDMLTALGTPTAIHGAPNEMAEAIPFADDRARRAYEPAWATRFWRVLLAADRVLKVFRTGFLGKASPVHFFWGSFDLAVTRFSGRPAPRHPGGVPHLPDPVAREAYSHEVSSAGFWPGGPGGRDAAFYSYAWPEPAGYREAAAAPADARFDAGLGEFVLPYDAVRTTADPEAALLAFLSSTYA
ncbi:MAG: hypothetical protein H0X27_07395, partial [Caulobacteraceae bacterium]|nr:hypothetical protein [Caulobacteraceae bacterium]